jgi:hypothetical protein
MSCVSSPWIRTGPTAVAALIAVIVSAACSSSGSGGPRDAGASEGAADEGTDDSSEAATEGDGGGSSSGPSSGGVDDSGLVFGDGPQFAPDGCAYDGVLCQGPEICCSGTCQQGVCTSNPKQM